MKLPKAISVDTNVLIDCLRDDEKGKETRQRLAHSCLQAGKAGMKLCPHKALLEELVHELDGMKKDHDSGKEKLNPVEVERIDDLHAWADGLRFLLETERTRGQHQKMALVYGNPEVYTPARDAENLGYLLCRETPGAEKERNDGILVAYACLEETAVYSKDAHVRDLIKTAQRLRQHALNKPPGQRTREEDMLTEHSPYPLALPIPEKGKDQNPDKSLEGLSIG
jgi:hypothetical protein